jgi:hypothetical protein
MTKLAETFKTEYENNNYDVWATVCSMDVADDYEEIDASWTDSEGNLQEGLALKFADGSSVAVHECDVEVILG